MIKEDPSILSNLVLETSQMEVESHCSRFLYERSLEAVDLFTSDTSEDVEI